MLHFVWQSCMTCIMYDKRCFGLSCVAYYDNKMALLRFNSIQFYGQCWAPYQYQHGWYANCLANFFQEFHQLFERLNFIFHLKITRTIASFSCSAIFHYFSLFSNNNNFTSIAPITTTFQALHQFRCLYTQSNARSVTFPRNI